MDYTASWPEPQPPPQHHHHPYNPYAAPPPPAHQLNPIPSYSSASYYPNPNPNPNPNPAPVPSYNHPNPVAPLPAVPDPYIPHGGYSVGPAASGIAGGGLAAYHYERIGGESHGVAVNEAIWQYGYGPVPPRPFNGLDPAVLSCVVPPQWGAKPNYEGGTKKGSKKTKVVQSAHCAVCKIDCDTQEVLNIHKQGKKHKKNLQKLQEAITPKPQKVQVTTNHAEKKEAPVADKGKAVGSKKSKRKEAPEEDLETKKRKILEGGAEPSEVRMCTLCNIVVNSQKVYDSHVAGSKHATMVKKQQEAAAS